MQWRRILVEFLAREREVLNTYVPGLEANLRRHALHQLEQRDGPAIEMFRGSGGTNLLIPAEHAGMGASALDAIRVQRAIGACAPSLAIATTMHHFSLASLIELWKREMGLEWLLLQGVAERRALLASGFAEGKTGQGVLAPTMRGTRSAHGTVLVTGSKKPCSLSRSMDILTASVLVSGSERTEDELCVAFISADLPGIEVEPFWASPLLSGAQSDAVLLKDVEVEEALVIPLSREDGGALDRIQAAGFVWFELLITASYLGIASAVVERHLHRECQGAWAEVAGAVELEAVMTSLEAVAQQVMSGSDPQELLPRVLHCRYAAQDAINRAVASAVELLGGMTFVKDGDVSYLAASRGLAFHPPSRMRAAVQLARAFTGKGFTIQ